MARSRGRAEMRRYMEGLPAQIERRLLRGAGRAAAEVVAEEARLTLGDRRAAVAGGAKVLIADAVRVKVTSGDGHVIAKVQVKGPGAYVAPWLEYGTAPHVIRARDEVREGRSIRRINKLVKQGSLVIGNNFVGASVQHPGARAHPFLFPALDNRKVDAIATGQAFINARIAGGRIVGGETETDA